MTLYGNGESPFKWSSASSKVTKTPGTTIRGGGPGRANFLDKEEGYFNQSTYYGEKEIAASAPSPTRTTPTCGGRYTPWSPGSFTNASGQRRSKHG
ncbi:MAG: hypothetical protein Ct9H300mP1_01230 [Planctomycetaceae bacterium]|nr:MAG: hypothetical protein Ct9H300mP1_01230 [Planctomycetaceae bacterium]